MHKRICIIGTGMGEAPGAVAAHPALATADAVIGGKKQLAAVPSSTVEKIAVTHDVEGVLDTAAALRNAGKSVVVLASGDPLFFGIGVRFAERFGPEGVTVQPNVSSLQFAAARLGLPWANVAAVSAHGRHSFLPFARALLSGRPVCLLTDAVNTPAKAAAFMQERGAMGFTAHVAAALGGPDETVWSGSIEEAAAQEFSQPNVAFFLPDPTFRPAFALCPGQPEEAFAHERGLLTKWPVRAAILAALRIEPGHTVWDLGAGSGSVAIEAASLARAGHVVAVEQHAARVAHILENRRRFGATVLDVVHGIVPQCLETQAHTETDLLFDGPMPRPDRVFIGGGLGSAENGARDTLRTVWQALAPGGRLAVSCVLLGSLEEARKELASLAGAVEVTLVQAACSAPLGSDARFEALNPVYIVSAVKNA